MARVGPHRHKKKRGGGNAQRKSVDSQQRKTGYLKENSSGEISSKQNSIRKLYSGMNGFEEGREYKMYSVKKL